MCGRYTITRPGDVLDDVCELLAAVELEVSPQASPTLSPRFNLAPTQAVPIVRRADTGIEIDLARWGFDSPVGERRHLINARLETVAEKPTFSNAFSERRCLLPADGFYEWDRSSRQPYFFSLPDRAAFCFAGIWQSGAVPVGPAPGAPKTGDRSVTALGRSACIMTAAANDVLRPIHLRMPLIVAAQAYRRWLAPEPLAKADIEQLLETSPAASLDGYPVSYDVNRVALDQSTLIEQRAPEPRNLSLF